ncbi:EpsG family protein [Dyadobacter sp. CY312]|uniref:EpsG family protein n=1 Tax=Dyadobacter sp. CY312 TaxID=2907303 RepID=UPI001F3A8A9D|nr:EpsG family protein [Dyadobacter sp. CY312]MCE7041277.1 EpsG family protein [Dyadobacter sp. CY312]
MFYYIVFILLSVLALAEMVVTPRNVKNWTFFVVIFVFILIGGLRWRTGSDWFPYFNFYTKFASDDPIFMLSMETGFTYFVGFLRLFSTQFTFYLLILSLITISLKALFFYRFTNALFLASLLFWGTALSDVIAVRQMLAISLCAVSTIYIVQKKPWIFALLVLLAAQIHVTAYVFLVSYKIYHLEWPVSSKYLILVFAVTFGLTVGSEKILEYAINIIPDGFGMARISRKAEAYMNIGNEITVTETLSKTQRTIAAVLKRAILLPVFFLFQNRLNSKPYNGFLNLYTFGNALYFIVIDFLTLQRAATYFYFFEIIIFCLIFENVKSKGIWLLIIILYSLLKLVSLILSAEKLLIPYIWIFSEDTYRFHS